MKALVRVIRTVTYSKNVIVDIPEKEVDAIPFRKCGSESYTDEELEQINKRKKGEAVLNTLENKALDMSEFSGARGSEMDFHYVSSSHEVENIKILDCNNNPIAMNHIVKVCGSDKTSFTGNVVDIYDYGIVQVEDNEGIIHDVSSELLEVVGRQE